jgi:hypothetical protein
VFSQAARVTRAEIIRAEDARGKGSSGIQPLRRWPGGFEPEAALDPRDRTPRAALPGTPRSSRSSMSQVGRDDRRCDRAIAAGAQPRVDAEGPSERWWTASSSCYGSKPWPNRTGCRRECLPAVSDVSRMTRSRRARAETALLALAAVGERPEAIADARGIAHGLYTLARSPSRDGGPVTAAIEWLRRAATYRPGLKTDVQVRRPAWLALNAAGGADKPTIEAAATDSDAQVRRLAVAALPNVEDPAWQRAQLDRAAKDPQPMVRWSGFASTGSSRPRRTASRCSPR